MNKCIRCGGILSPTIAHIIKCNDCGNTVYNSKANHKKKDEYIQTGDYIEKIEVKENESLISSSSLASKKMANVVYEQSSNKYQEENKVNTTPFLKRNKIFFYILMFINSLNILYLYINSIEATLFEFFILELGLYIPMAIFGNYIFRSKGFREMIFLIIMLILASVLSGILTGNIK